MQTDLVAHEALIEFLYRAPIGLLQARPDGEITMINPMSAQLLMPLAPTGDLSNLYTVLAALAPELPALVATHTAPGSVVCDALRLPLGVVVPGQPPQTLALSLTRLDDATLMGCVSDVSHTVRAEQQRLDTQLHDVNRTDALTALPNRAVVRERITRALASQRADAEQRFAVLFINADRFNQINLAHGTATGDAVLRQMAQRLHATVRPGDAVGRAVPPASTAARLGGDEFVVVVEGLRAADDVHGIALRLVDSLSRPYLVDSLLLHLGVSVGVAAGDAVAADADADAMLQDAGIAMREAKRAGGARHATFDPAMKVRATHRLLLERELRRALAEGELFVVYQPIVHLGGSPAVSVEALVRWQHPLRGTVPPLAFIEVAEQTGLIGALGVFVLETACRQFMQWRHTLGNGAPQGLSVNLSRAQLTEPALVAQVGQVLRTCGMPPAALQLEVTESLAAQDDGVRAQLQALKALGLTLALDDFGTGYSSLSSLHQLPVDLVKIDRSFVSQLETSAHHRALVKATVDVASSLGMGTVAEGIETPGQAAVLQDLRCQKGQGYWFARPMPGDALPAWLAARADSLRPTAPAPAAASRSA